MAQTVNPPVVCTDQNLVRTRVSETVNNEKVFKRVRAAQTMQGQVVTVRHAMSDTEGNPVDLSECLKAGGSLRGRINETLLCPTPGPVEFGEVVPTDNANAGADGCVDVSIPEVAVAAPGISKVEVALLDANGAVIFTNWFYFVVNRGLWGPGTLIAGGPPTIPEIRLHLRDSGREDNLWLGIEEFDLAEIAACIERPILYWNESQPPLNYGYNTANFPYRFYWLEGIIACLYDLATLHYMRVHLPYQQQGGLMIDDKNKAKEYAAIADKKWNEYKDWTLRKKVELNAWGAVQQIGSPYFGVIWKNPQI